MSLKQSFNSTNTDTILASKLIHGDIIEVFSDDVISVERVNYSGHVYNLETVSGWYATDYIITHNCRSVTVPIFNEDEKLDGRRPENGDKRGTVSANETYASWFDKQSDAFQQEWLGPSRYKLYKDGKYAIDRFVDPQTGKQYSLAELQEKDEQTFKDIFGE